MPKSLYSSAAVSAPVPADHSCPPPKDSVSCLPRIHQATETDTIRSDSGQIVFQACLQPPTLSRRQHNLLLIRHHHLLMKIPQRPVVLRIQHREPPSQNPCSRNRPPIHL